MPADLLKTLDTARDPSNRFDVAVDDAYARAGNDGSKLTEWLYIVEVLQALDAYADLIRSRPTVVAGDFNNAVFWDRPGKPSNHSVVVEKLDSLGLASAYHTSRGVEQGQEPEPTLFWTWREKLGYHVDYIWLPKAWLDGVRAVEIGDCATWVASQLSDHVPLVADVDVSADSPTA